MGNHSLKKVKKRERLRQMRQRIMLNINGKRNRKGHEQLNSQDQEHKPLPTIIDHLHNPVIIDVQSVPSWLINTNNSVETTTETTDDRDQYEVIIKTEVELDEETPSTTHAEEDVKRKWNHTSKLNSPQVMKTQEATDSPARNTNHAEQDIERKWSHTSELSSPQAVKTEAALDAAAPNTSHVENDIKNTFELSSIKVDPQALEWMERLSKLPPQQRLLAEKAFNDVIHRAELGKLHEE
ncbi:uncharacterized protein LOC126967503 isoform X2 [Leptidea sinapis]|uniref:uncharacterized protein LOC126967503 isoform X2 n=1 Tax=Leptidea sinapis TaxID=189913 RepID=UPI002146C57D|nr:uncharacterized protein LOC126967503 isoform X2 [Leptidea sinapis]